LTVAELEGVEETGRGLGDVLTGKVLEVEPHPTADRLRIVEVDLGDRRVRGVSGAPNLRKGMIAPVALPGCGLPGGNVVESVEIRGVRSEAVLLSEREMGLSDEHEGLMVLPEGTQQGRPLCDVLPVEDVVFDVDNKSITHRPDLWGHYGVAREVAAIVGRPLEALETDFEKGEADLLDVTVDDGDDCPRYMAMCYSGIIIQPSPFKVCQRLRAVGMRPISNVVDVTNYVMLAVGEPTHAFDRRQINGDVIRVRRAEEGESFRTLDGIAHELTADDLLIADHERGIALAGVMGGENSEIADDTTDVVLECATFHPGLVRKTSVRHGIRTESSARFEKSLDPNLPLTAMAMFTKMVMETSPGAVPSSMVYDRASFNRDPITIKLDPDYVINRLGVVLPPAGMKTILEGLGFKIDGSTDGLFNVKVPSFRATRDVSIPEDLVEEVGRVIGYDHVPPEAPSAPVHLVPREPMRDLCRRIRRILSSSCGLDEVMTYSFDSRQNLRKIGFEPDDAIGLKNVLSNDMKTLRTELAPNLLGVIERNANRYDDFGIYEIGRVFPGGHDEEGIPIQPRRLGIVIYDRNGGGTDGNTVMFRRMKGVIGYLAGRLEIGEVVVETPIEVTRPWIHPRQAVKIEVGGKELGYCTGVHPATIRSLDCVGGAMMAEIDLEALVSIEKESRKFKPIPRHPAIRSDLSFVVDEKIESRTIEELIRDKAGENLVSVRLVDVYEGAPIPEGRKSLSFRMKHQAADRTLAEDEVKEAIDRVIDAAGKAGASIRDS